MRSPRLRIHWIAIIVYSCGCMRSTGSADYAARIGIAVKLPDRICMAIHNSRLLPSATITLLSPSNLPTSARAQVKAPSPNACPGTRADTEISSYNLELTSGSIERNLPVVALEARVPSVDAAHSFHSCTSADGVHLTAWDGAKPLEGHRLWHQYYYLGQDLEANCTAAEATP